MMSKMLDEKNFEKFMYGHPTINGNDTIYKGRRTRKKTKVVEEPPSYDLRGTQHVLSSILQTQMEKNRKKMENSEFVNSSSNVAIENSLLGAIESNNNSQFNRLNIFPKENDNFLSNSNNMNNLSNYNNSINNSQISTPPPNTGFMSSIYNELEREAQRANREFNEREKAMSMSMITALSNQLRPIPSQSPNPNMVDSNGKPLVKRKRGRPPKNPNRVNNIIQTESKNIPITNNIAPTTTPTSTPTPAPITNIPNPNTNPDINTNTNINPNINNNINANANTTINPNPNVINNVNTNTNTNTITNVNTTIITNDIDNRTEKKDRTPRKYNKRGRGRSYGDYFYGSHYGDSMIGDSENNDMNLLEILFKEYGYNNIVYVLTDSPEIKLGETKIKKIKSGLSTLLGYENNISKVIETIINMRKSNLIDESWIKGKYNYRTRNKNNLYIASYHYQLNNDGFIYKFKHSKILHDGSIRFKCCDPKCNGRGVLYPRIKKFKTFSRHTLAPMDHEYMKDGYDKFQFKMEMKNWKEMSLKDNPDDKKTYIDWHKPIKEKKI